MKLPHIHMLMMSTLDGRIIVKHWPNDFDESSQYESVHRELGGDAWIVGRVTMAEFSEGEPIPTKAQQRYPRTTWKADGVDRTKLAVAIDGMGKLHLNTGRVNGDAVVAVLAEAVSDDHLAELHRDNISYLFAGQDEIDLSLAMQKLRSEFGVKTLLLEGGGHINGSFLKANLIDEITLLVAPFVDGKSGTPAIFDSPSPLSKSFSLLNTTTLANSVVRLHYSSRRELLSERAD
jgi:riboflavin biosynthesis pyrimidine reductase